jgi:hypothetical protein
MLDPLFDNLKRRLHVEDGPTMLDRVDTASRK